MSFTTDADVFLPPEDTSVLPEDIALDDPTEDDTTGYYGSEYHFDFETGQFVTGDDGKVTLIEGPDAVGQSLRKALATPMGTYLAYPLDYGNELANAVAETPVGATVEDLALSYCADVIDSDPRVAAADELDATVDAEAETVTLTGVALDRFGAIIDLDITIDYTPMV